MRILLVIILLAGLNSAMGQPLSYYHDGQDKFYVYNNGEIEKLDYRPAREIGISRKFLIYTNGSDEVKVYFKGQQHTLTTNDPQDMFVGDYYAAYYYNEQITVLDHNGNRTLGVFNPAPYGFGDSIIAYHDHIRSFYVEWLGVNVELEMESVSSLKVSTNLVAYVSPYDRLEAWYHGEKYTIDNQIPKGYLVGTGTVGFINSYDEFHWFNRGYTEMLEYIKPKNFKVGEHIIAYVDDSDNFKVVSPYGKETLNSEAPQFYDLVEDMMIWSDGADYFYVFYDGENIELESYTPSSYKMDRGVLVYKDLDGRLKGFYKGKKVEISDEIVSGYELHNDVIRYQVLPYDYKFYHD